jgi:hypothetical protein
VSDINDLTTSTPIKVNQDVNIFVVEVDDDRVENVATTVNFLLKKNRQAYLLCIEGAVAIENNADKNSFFLEKYDAAELYGENFLSIKNLVSTEDEEKKFKKKSHLLLVEMNFTGVGRTDL